VEGAQPSSFAGLDQVNAVVASGMGPGTYSLWIVENGVASNTVQFDLLARTAPPTNGACLGHVSIVRVPGQTGEQFAGTVSLAYPAQAGGVTVLLQGGDDAVTVPASVTIPEGQTSGNFAFALSGPHTASPIAVTASLNGGTLTGTFNEGDPCVNRVWLSTAGIVSGQSLSGTVAVTDPAPASGTSVSLMSSDPSVELMSPTVMIPAGRMSADFMVMTAQSLTPNRATIIAQGSCGGSATGLNVVVAPCVSSVSVSASSVAGGGSVTATLTMSAPVLSGGLTVNLKSSDPSVQVPASLIVPEGQVSVTFGVKTTAGVKAVAAVTAYMNCGSAAAVITVQ
jgi:hypothetical protein